MFDTGWLSISILTGLCWLVCMDTSAWLGTLAADVLGRRCVRKGQKMSLHSALRCRVAQQEQLLHRQMSLNISFNIKKYPHNFSIAEYAEVIFCWIILLIISGFCLILFFILYYTFFNFFNCHSPFHLLFPNSIYELVLRSWRRPGLNLSAN